MYGIIVNVIGPNDTQSFLVTVRAGTAYRHLFPSRPKEKNYL